MTYVLEISNGEDTETRRYDSEYGAALCFAEVLESVLAFTDNPFHRGGTVISLRQGDETILEYRVPLE